MVNQHRIRTDINRRINQRQARCHACDNLPDTISALNLQAVWAIVCEH
jgi:hypothetical protein